MSRLASLVCSGVCLVASVMAQSDRGTITGRVLDPTQSAVPGATVAAANAATGIKYTATTNDTGNYSIQQVPAGTYEVTIEASGFRRYVQKAVELNVAQTATLNVTLDVGQVEQTIEVTESAGVIESSTSDLGTVISRERMIDLPLSVSANMRSPEQFIFLAPGVTGNARDTQINGSQSRAKEVLLDGVSSVSPESGGILFTYPSVESIGEFKLLSANFSAEYGRTGGGFEIFTT
ncbi:MAG: carboxypeptidase regulatory-like domain-containing protein, partial [Bryobacteraceae bacterium]|nr:carboxypeptidase regulatory-like domain-containing protein [Bryobacteraceae bacterium]